MGVYKNESGVGTPLSWNFHGQKQIIHTEDGGANGELEWVDLWAHEATGIDVPLDDWITLKFYIKEGKGTDGRVWAEMVHGDDTYTLIDQQLDTIHPDKPNLEGFGSFQPMKLYTSGAILDGLEPGAAFEILWDDFQLWTDKHPE